MKPLNERNKKRVSDNSNPIGRRRIRIILLFPSVRFQILFKLCPYFSKAPKTVADHFDSGWWAILFGDLELQLIQLCGGVERELERLSQAADEFCAPETSDYPVFQCLRQIFYVDEADCSRCEGNVHVNGLLGHSGLG